MGYLSNGCARGEHLYRLSCRTRALASTASFCKSLLLVSSHLADSHPFHRYRCPHCRPPSRCCLPHVAAPIRIIALPPVPFAGVLARAVTFPSRCCRTKMLFSKSSNRSPNAMLILATSPTFALSTASGWRGVLFRKLTLTLTDRASTDNIILTPSPLFSATSLPSQTLPLPPPALLSYEHHQRALKRRRPATCSSTSGYEQIPQMYISTSTRPQRAFKRAAPDALDTHKLPSNAPSVRPQTRLQTRPQRALKRLKRALNAPSSSMPSTRPQHSLEVPLMQPHMVCLFNQFFTAKTYKYYSSPLPLPLERAASFCAPSWDATRCPSSPCASSLDAPHPPLSCASFWDNIVARCLLRVQ